jgi:protocatechuate 3,4-dioxygenase, beta subunit
MKHPGLSPLLLARRQFLRRAIGASALFATPGAFAEALTLTQKQTEGPFYPDKLPLDTDNDLLVLNDSLTPAVGEVTWLTGKVLDAKGNPLRGATVEIWQCDAKGSYLHSRGGNPRSDGSKDAGFQGFGRFLTGSTGEYQFRTIKPVPYPGRTPHIHVMVKKADSKLLTTQCYIKGHELNKTDGIYQNIKDAKARDSVTVDWQPLPGAPAGEWLARFDIVVGLAPEDTTH